jgi:hypothetical protein
MSKPIPRWETPEYHATQAGAVMMSDADLEAAINSMRIRLAAYGDALQARRRKIDPARLAASYGALSARKR